MIESRYSVQEFKQLPEDLRMGIIISDGMWYSFSKWRRMAKVSEPVMRAWIEENLESGVLIQAQEGEKSYRFSLENIEKWHKENGYKVGEQLVDFLFPPRIWSGMTETEGFLKAPLREIGIVSFNCASHVALEVEEALRGVARVRETEPCHYKAYCLDTVFTKLIVEKIFANQAQQDIERLYTRAVAKRRELVDFPSEFNHGLVLFYRMFGKTLVKGAQETIDIFLPNKEDQETQIVVWVISAIEKFDESASVPFSGYLNSVLRRWPYDLPYMHLGKELSSFQRERAKALDVLKKSDAEKFEFTSKEIADEMGFDLADFNTLENKHKVWIGTRSATPLTWTENGEERVSGSLISSPSRVNAPTDVRLAHRLSFATIQAAILTENYEDALIVIDQIDASKISLSSIKEISEDFILALGAELGIAGDG